MLLVRAINFAGNKSELDATQDSEGFVEQGTAANSADPSYSFFSQEAGKLVEVLTSPEEAADY